MHMVFGYKLITDDKLTRLQIRIGVVVVCLIVVLADFDERFIIIYSLRSKSISK